MTDRNGLTESPAEPRALLGVLYGVIEEAERYEGCLQGTERLNDRELADFLSELRDGTRRRADRAQTLLAQRLANGGAASPWTGGLLGLTLALLGPMRAGPAQERKELCAGLRAVALGALTSP